MSKPKKTDSAPSLRPEDVLALQELAKGWKQIPNTQPERSPKGWFFDPLALYQAQGYIERKVSYSYQLLRAVVKQVAILQAIINTRKAQVASFSEPYRKTRSVGFAIKHKDSDHATTPAEIQFIKELENFISNCGRSEKNPYSKVKRDDFDTFLRKIVNDSLTLDAVAAEIIPDRLGIPYEFYAHDAATIRYVGEHPSNDMREGFDFYPYGSGRESDYTQAEDAAYVQVINGQKLRYFTESELAYGIRNPRTDITANGYGESEIEQIFSVITYLLNVEAYWKNMFMNNSMPKGILNFKGDIMSPEMLEGFKRSIVANVKGVENAFNIPIMNQPEGLEWHDLYKSNLDMGLIEWQQYLIKIVCGVYLIDPAEISFVMSGGAATATPLFEGNNEWKIKASKDKGLLILLKFIAKYINTNIINKIDDHFEFSFIGLDELTQQESHQMKIEELASFKTMNEIRREMDLPELPAEYDTVCNPVYIQNKAQLQQQQLAQQQAEQQQMVMQQQQEQQAAQEQQIAGEQQETPPEANTEPSYPELATEE